MSLRRGDFLSPNVNIAALGTVHTVILKCAGFLERNDLKALSTVYSLDLSHCTLPDGFDDLCLLKNVHTLKLTATNIKSVSAFGSVHTLVLSHCPLIVDVKQLGDVHSLDLSNCIRLIDVNALQKVHTLKLSHCTSITDVSSLRNVSVLDVSGCSQRVRSQTARFRNMQIIGNLFELGLISESKDSEESDFGLSETKYFDPETVWYQPFDPFKNAGEIW